MKKMKFPISKNSIRRLRADIDAFRKERFSAGYNSALGMIERGEISADKLEKIHDCVEYGPGIEDESCRKFNEWLIDGEGGSCRFSVHTIGGAACAIRDAWQQVLKSK